MIFGSKSNFLRLVSLNDFSKKPKIEHIWIFICTIGQHLEAKHRRKMGGYLSVCFAVLRLLFVTSLYLVVFSRWDDVGYGTATGHEWLSTECGKISGFFLIGFLYLLATTTISALLLS